MSRIGKQPIPIPSGVNVTVKDNGTTVAVSGPKGQLEKRFRDSVTVAVNDSQVEVKRNRNDKPARAMHGLTRALVANMVKGVTDGYTRALQINGVGYDAKVQGDILQIRVGFACPVDLKIPKTVAVKCPHPTSIEVSGPDNQQVGQFAAVIRRIKPPDPYTLKGIKYADEVLKKKPGKAFGAEKR